MKKIMSLVFFTLILMSIIPLGLAQEETEATEVELEQEIQTMSTIDGAQYRLDQLALSLENQIEHAKDILSEVNVSDEIMEELNGYVVEMELLLERVNELEPSGTPSEMAAEFVAIKKQAITLTQNFRKTLYSAVRQERIEQIKEQVRETKELRKQELKAELEEKKENMYMNRINHILNAIGEDASEIIEQYQNGEITREEAAALIKEKYDSLSQEEKDALKSEIKSQAEQVKANLEARKEQAKAAYEAKKAEIKANAEARREQLKAKFQAALEERKANAEARREQLKANLEARRLGADPTANAENQNN